MKRIHASAIKERIYARLVDQGWPLRSNFGLPECCIRDQLVAPFYVCSGVISRGRDSFHVEGAVGIVHQQFEHIWARRPDRDPKEPGFGFIVLASNIQELRGYQKLDASSSMEEQLSLLCTAISRVLTGMPQNEQQLTAEFGDGKMFGLPVEFLSMPRYQLKCSAFKEFVDGLAASGVNSSAPVRATPPELVGDQSKISIRVLQDGEFCVINDKKVPFKCVAEYLRDTLAVPWGTVLTISIDGTKDAVTRGQSLREALVRIGYRRTVSVGFLTEPPNRSSPN